MNLAIAYLYAIDYASNNCILTEHFATILHLSRNLSFRYIRIVEQSKRVVRKKLQLIYIEMYFDRAFAFISLRLIMVFLTSKHV